MSPLFKDNTRIRFIAAESESLVIETIQTKSKTRRESLRILRLKGIWRANAYNQLVFEISGHKGPPEKFTFQGLWKVNKNQEIEYSLKDGRGTLSFKGHWQILSANKLVYIFEGSSKSRFEFKVQFESLTLQPKKGAIRYRIGIGLRKRRATLSSPQRVIILFGEWKFGRNLGISFTMHYGQGRVRAMEFGAEAAFERNRVILALKNELGKPLGLTLTLTRKLFEALDAKAFIRLKARSDAKGIEAGISIPF